MIMRFPVYLHKTETNTYSGFAPDIMGCFFAGSTVDEALSDAYEAIDAHIESLADAEKAIPQARTIEEHIDDEDCQGGLWAFVEVDITKYDSKAIRLNITLPQNLLTGIDYYVESHKEYGSRSGFIAAIARRELSKAS